MFRLFRRHRIAPGVTLNFSKGTPSLTFGTTGRRTTLRSDGVQLSFGVPGTGMHWRYYIGPHGISRNPPPLKRGIFGRVVDTISGKSSKHKKRLGTSLPVGRDVEWTPFGPIEHESAEAKSILRKIMEERR